MKKVIKRSVLILISVLLMTAVAAGISGAAATGKAGDVNKDGQVNNKDVVSLFRVSSGIAVDVDEKACDANGDGTINNKDVLVLFRYVNGLGGELHYGVDEEEPGQLTALVFPEDVAVTEYLSSTNATFTKTEDNTIIVKSEKKAPSVTVNAAKLAEYEGVVPTVGRYLAVQFRAEGQNSDTCMTLKSLTDANGKTVTITQKAAVDCDNTGNQGALFDLRDCNVIGSTVSKIAIQLNSQNPEGSTELIGIVLTDDLNEALKSCFHPEYCLNYDKTLTDNDPLAHTVLVADKEDATVKLWFDHSTEKVKRTDVNPTDRTGYTVRMAKNEAENCQFFIAPETTLNVRVEVEEFKNENGKTVPFELYYEYYHNISGEMIPDALPPYTTPVEVAGGNSQGFVIQLTTQLDTEAGTYNSVIHVYNNDTGDEIKRAAVAVKVWNIELSEKTEMRTAFLMWYNDSFLGHAYNWDVVDYTYGEVVDNFFEFFLKYRINIIDNPHGLSSGYADNYMKQDRVNTARWGYLDMSIADDREGLTPTWMDKVIYYTIDEPGAARSIETDLANLRDTTSRIKNNTPDYRMVAPFNKNFDLTASGSVAKSFESADTDLIGYMSDYLNIWCPIISGFTQRDLGFVSRTTFLQNKQQDEKYGELADRLNKYVEERGDELWMYICYSPTEPYVNWQLLSDGTETIVSAWQMKKYNITGMLYWAVNYWKVNYWSQDTPWTGSAFGDGMLVYSGYRFNVPYPISTVRLEGIRDGIEDYQMLCMLEDALGAEAAEDMVNRVATSVVTFTNDDDYLHAVRVLLGDTLEAALNGK